MTRSYDVFFDLCLNKRLSRDAGDLRRHRAHYDVTVMTTGYQGSGLSHGGQVTCQSQYSETGSLEKLSEFQIPLFQTSDTVHLAFE